MAGSPKYKVYDADGEYLAACKRVEDAAILVSIGYPDRGTVRLGHGRILFTSTKDTWHLDYDDIAERILKEEGRTP